MNFLKLKFILWAAAITMIIHTAEEYITQLWKYDSFIISFSQWSSISPIVVYLGIQFVALFVIFIALFLATENVFSKSLGMLLGLIFLLELLHPYNSIRVLGYSPGLYSGVILVIIGYFYWKEFLIGFRNLKRII